MIVLLIVDIRPIRAAEEVLESGAPAKSVAVHGVVVDGSGRPVPGASISVRFGGEEITRAADSKGCFCFEIPFRNMPNATFLASGPGGTLGFVQLPWEIDSPDAIAPQRIELASPRRIEVSVVSREGTPVAEAEVVVNAHYRTISRTTTDKEGHASLAVLGGLSLQFVLAEAAGRGIDYVLFRGTDEPASDPYKLPQDHGEKIVLTLSPTRSLTVRAVDQDGKPVEGAQVSPWYITLPKKGGYANLGSLWLKETGGNGLVTYDAIPLENEHNLIIWVRKDGFAAKEERSMFDPRSSQAEVTATLLPLVPVAGRVVYANGSPAAGIGVHVGGDDYSLDSFRDTTITSDDGSFRFDVRPNTYCLFVAGNDQWASALETRVVLLGKPIDAVTLRLQRATRVFGRLTTGDENEPMKGEHVALYQMESKDGKGYYDLPPEERLSKPANSRFAISPRIVRSTRSDEDGRFEFYAGPGGFYVIGPRGANTQNFTIEGQEEVEVNLHGRRKVEGTLKGRVVLRSNPDQGVAEVQVFGYSEGPGDRSVRATTDATGRFEARRSESAQLVGAFSENRQIGAIVRAEARAESIVLALAPTATLRGTLIDGQTGRPAVDREISASIRVGQERGPFMHAFPRNDTTDDAGRFEIPGVVPGHPYGLLVVVERDSEGQSRSWQPVGEVKPPQAEMIELGELRLPAPYRAPTTEDYIAAAFKGEGDLSERLARRLADARLAYQQVLLVAADPGSDVTRQFFEAQYNYSKRYQPLREALANYMILGVDVREQTQTALLKDLGIAAPDKDAVTFVVLDPEERAGVEAACDELASGGNLDEARLTEFLNTRRVPLPDAEKELSSALALAMRENKRVLVQVSGPGCAPCILLSRYLDSQKELISKDYVYLKLDWRMPKGPAVIEKVRYHEEGGVPWMSILSADGETLATSDSEQGNIGYPSSEQGKAHFEQMLRTTRQRLSDGEIATLMAGLRE